MPNHTTNQLTVTGPADSIVKMKEFAKSEEAALECNSILPMPEALKGTTKGFGMANDETLAETHAREQREAKLVEDFGFDNWYDWCVANWGTKWGVYHLGDMPLKWHDELEGVSMEFWSAWEPPIPVIAELARRFPDLTFVLDYSDEGGGYAGQAVFEGENDTDYCTQDAALIEAKNQVMGLIE